MSKKDNIGSDVVTLYTGDALEVLREMPDAFVDSVVTDPPYGKGDKLWKETDCDGNVVAWDADVPSATFWQEVLRVLKPGGYVFACGATRTYHRLASAIEDAGFEIRDQFQWLYATSLPKSRNLKGKWEGWGTAVKPAHEPICLARKPLIGTVEDNMQQYGTGALNIDGCRVGSPESKRAPGTRTYPAGKFVGGLAGGGIKQAAPHDGKARWPTNVLLDEYAANLLEQQKKGVSRFLYCAKPSKKERGEENDHPTVKPVALMRYLVRLVTPPGGLVLDPFLGSGTTAIAAISEGMRIIGIELIPRYMEIAKKRISYYVEAN